MAITQSHKFTFDTSFDPEDIRQRREQARQRVVAEREAQEAADRARIVAEEEAAAAPPPPTFSEEELSAARTAAYADGEAAGERAASARVEAKLAEALAQIPGRLTPLVDAQKRSDAAITEHAVRIAVTITRRLFPDLAKRRGLAEIEALIRDSLADMIDEPRLVVRVADEHLDMVRARLDPMVQESGYEGSVVLLAEPGLGPADCRVDWADGGAERLSDRLWQDVDTAIARFLEYPQTAPTDVQPPSTPEEPE